MHACMPTGGERDSDTRPAPYDRHVCDERWHNITRSILRRGARSVAAPDGSSMKQPTWCKLPPDKFELVAGRVASNVAENILFTRAGLQDGTDGGSVLGAAAPEGPADAALSEPGRPDQAVQPPVREAGSAWQAEAVRWQSLPQQQGPPAQEPESGVEVGSRAGYLQADDAAS